MEVETVTGKITIDASGAVSGYNQAAQGAQGYSSAATGVTAADGKVVDSQTKVTTATKDTGEAAKTTTGSFKNAVTATSELALSGLSLYNSLDSIEKAQLRLDKANKTEESSKLALTKAQNDYNDAVEKYGIDSDQAKTAADKLTIAQDAYDNSITTVKLDQDHLNEVTAQTAITILPALITGVDGAVKAYKTLKDLNMGETIGGITQAIKNNGDMLVGVAAAGAAFFFMYEAFNSKDPTTRAEFSLLGGALLTVAIAEWAVAAGAIAAEEILTLGGATVLIGVALAAAGAIYAASTMFGAGAAASSSPPGSEQLSSSSSSSSSSAASASSSGSSSGSSSSDGSSGLNSVAKNSWQAAGISQSQYDQATSQGATWNASTKQFDWNHTDNVSSGTIQNVTINVDGSKDADITAAAVAQKLKDAGM